ncbi:hypothetical protein [Thioclava sp. GXIMD4215]|uniref:hypothetical protein n=1 Tax=Thioclava sp. GXIMD4215 TaxID=3131928 RepID=UPI0032500734
MNQQLNNYAEGQLRAFAKMTGDDQVCLLDLGRCSHCADYFGVTLRMAYSRAKSLGLLSYQQDAITPAEANAKDEQAERQRATGHHEDSAPANRVVRKGSQ